MNRKRAAQKKLAAKKPITPSVNVDEQVFIANSVIDEINKDLRYSSSSSSSDNGGSFLLEISSSGPDEPATVTNKRKGETSTSTPPKKKRSVGNNGGQKKGETSRRTTNSSVVPPRGLVANVTSSRQTINSSVLRLREFVPDVIPSRASKATKGLSSLSRKELPSPKVSSEDPRYNKLELKTSLAVIKKIMQMDEAVSFNAPVDPVAQGLPDYFNVIDTPMDFGTICSNLQNGVKYLNSDDVYKDVNYIWENCRKYNKKGDYIVFLMKRVKKKFINYWMSAGLRTEILKEHNGHSHSMPSSDHSMWQSRHEALSMVNRMASNSNRMQQDNLGTSEPQPEVVLSGNVQPHQSRQPQPSTTQVPLFSQLHTGEGSNYTDMTRSGARDTGGHRKDRDSHGKFEDETSSVALRIKALQNPSLPNPVDTISISQRMAPQKGIRSEKGRKKARAVASRFKSASMKLAGSNQRSEPDKPGKKKAQCGTKRKTVETGVHEASSSKRRLCKDISQSEPAVEDQAENVEEAEMVQNLTGGLKLLKRETVTMAWLAKTVIQGKSICITYNRLGDPIGKEHKWLQSYIGVLARTRIPVSYKVWFDVPADEKEKIWESVTKIFVLPQSKKKEVISSAATKWRNFKAMLTSKYIMPHKDDIEALENVPDDYRFMNKENWHDFVTHRLSPEQLEIREIQIERRRKNKYNHRLSRSGYVGVRNEMAATMSLEDIHKVGRHDMWIKARQDKQGKFKDAEMDEAVQKIRELEKQEVEGTFKASGTVDVLSAALGNEEHRGRVRGVGALKTSLFFKLPPGQRGRKKKNEELADLVAKERVKWEAEMKKKHEEDLRELGQKYEAKLKQSEEQLDEKLSLMIDAKLGSKNIVSDNDEIVSPVYVTSVKSAEGSCSKQGVVGTILGNYEAVKKKLVLRTLSEQKDDQLEVDDIPENACTTPFEAEIQKSIDEEKEKSGKIDVILALDSIDNVVAYGRIVKSIVDPEQETIHGKKLSKEEIRVEVLIPLIGEAKVPIPIKGEIEFVKEAVGSIVAWPKKLCVVGEVIDGVPRIDVDKDSSIAKEDMSAKKNKKLSMLVINDKEEDLKELPADLPHPLVKLYRWGVANLHDGKTIYAVLGSELFGHLRKAAIFRGDIYAMVQKNETSANTIVFYISHLHNCLKKAACNESILFVDPKDTFAIGTNKNPTDRSIGLMDRFNTGKKGSMFLIPYNTGCHWTLTVVDLENKKVYYLDPLRRRLPPPNDQWRDVVEHGMRFYYAQKAPKKKLKISINWINCLGIPKQPDGKTCGLFIMRFMRDIVAGRSIKFIEKTWLQTDGSRYTDNDIDVVRKEWAEHVMSFTS